MYPTNVGLSYSNLNIRSWHSHSYMATIFHSSHILSTKGSKSSESLWLFNWWVSSKLGQNVTLISSQDSKFDIDKFKFQVAKKGFILQKNGYIGWILGSHTTSKVGPFCCWAFNKVCFAFTKSTWASSITCFLSSILYFIPNNFLDTTPCFDLRDLILNLHILCTSFLNSNNSVTFVMSSTNTPMGHFVCWRNWEHSSMTSTWIATYASFNPCYVGCSCDCKGSPLGFKLLGFKLPPLFFGIFFFILRRWSPILTSSLCAFSFAMDSTIFA